MSNEANEAIAKEAIAEVRPLTATQAKNLKELVANDFAQLRSEVRTHASQMKAAQEQEIMAGVNEEARTALLERARQAASEYRQSALQLEGEARVDGFNLRMPSINPDVISLGTVRANELIQLANAQIEAELQQTLQVLETQHHKAHRMVLQASITGAAEDVLATIPTAAELLATAAEERAARPELT